MKFASSWRFSIALVAIGLLVAFAALPSGPKTAEATVNSLNASSMFGEDGDAIAITVVGTPAAGDMDLTTNSDETFTLTSCTTPTPMDCSGAVTGGGGATLTLDTTDGTVDDTYTLVASMTLNCSEPESITVIASDDDNNDSTTVFCVPDLNDPQVIVEKESDDSGDYDFDWRSSSGDCLVSADDGTLEIDDAGGFDLGDGDQAYFWCEDSVDFLVVEEEDDADFVEIEDCDEGDEGVDEIDGATVDFDIEELEPSDTVRCTWVNDDDFEPIDDNVGPAATVSILLSASTIDCGGSTLVQVRPRSAEGGPAQAGTAIALTSSLGGTFQPSSSVTSVFPVTLASFLYTAPDDVDGTTTITARAGNVQTTAAVRIVCEVAPATATPAPLAPPSAGSGGLAGGSGGGSYIPFALAVAAVAVAGIVATTRRFATAPAGAAELSLPDVEMSSHRPGGFALLASFLMLVVALLAKRWL